MKLLPYTLVISYCAMIIVSLCAADCANFKIIYERVFDKQIQIYRNKSMWWTQNMTFISLNQNRSSIWDIMELQNEEEESANVFLFFTQEGLFYERLLVGIPEERKINFATSADSLDQLLANTLHAECLIYSAALKRALLALVFSLFLQDIAIVSDNTNCSLKFHKSLETALLHHVRNSEISLKLHHVTYNPNEPISKRSKFYHLKTIDISLLILLVAPRHTTGAFKRAEHFGLLSTSHLWLIPSAGYNSINQNHEGKSVALETAAPSRTMTFDFISTDPAKKTHNSTYTTLSSSILDLVTLYNNVSNLYCKKLPLQDTGFGIKTQLYGKLLENERRYNTVDLQLDVKYRDLTDSDNNWIRSSAEIVGEGFSLLDDNIALLRNVKAEIGNQDSRIRAVTVIDDPYSFEIEERYDLRTNMCSSGLKCWKPIKNTNANTNNNTTYKLTCCYGYVIDFFELLVKDLSLDVDMYIVEDNKYGAFHDGRWNGLIGDVAYGKVDIAVGSISVTGERSKVVDFTSPWGEGKLGVLVRPDIVSLDFVNFEFIAPLNVDLQIALWITIFWFVIMIFILENCVYFVSLTRQRYLTERFYSLYESISYMGGVTFQRDLGGIHPVRPGARVAALFFAFGMMVIVTTYTALLVDQGVNREEKDPFLGSRDPRMRNPTTEYTFATMKSTSYETFFANSESDVFRRVSMFMKDYNVESTKEAVNKIKQGTLNAYFYDYDFLVWYVSRDRNCELSVLKDPLIPAGLAFATTKNSRWLSNFNNAIFRYRGSDEIQNLHKKWFFSGGCSVGELDGVKIRLAINNFGGYILLLIGTIVACFLMLIPERIYLKHFRNKVSRALRKFFGWCEHGTLKRQEKKYEVNQLER